MKGYPQQCEKLFVRLYEKGLIYWGPRLINWSPGLKTAVSDLEVEYSEEPGVPLLFQVHAIRSDRRIHPGSDHPPETILGDSGGSPP
jgi:valyl-tRNA synthetase